MHLTPWYEAHVDCVGNWPFTCRGVKYNFKALTTIDPVTNLVEIELMKKHTSAEAARAFEDSWLARYPKPACLGIVGQWARVSGLRI